jgi:nucleoside-diphosphate-sugar epimerase
MRIFLAGATGAIGRRLVPLLLADRHTVVGSTRKAERTADLAARGVTPAVVDFMNGEATRAAVLSARPEVVIHELTDLPQVREPADWVAALERNTQLRIVATENLVQAAIAAGAGRVIAQSIAFAYAPGPLPHPESDPIDPASRGVLALEHFVLETPGITGVVLRYGRLYGPGTWSDGPTDPPAVHVDAAAQATALALTRGAAGAYNIAEDDGAVSIGKGRAALGFDPAFRLE